MITAPNRPHPRPTRRRRAEWLVSRTSGRRHAFLPGDEDSLCGLGGRSKSVQRPPGAQPVCRSCATHERKLRWRDARWHRPPS